MAKRTKKEKKLRVLVFSTPSCPHCRTAKRYLRKKGIPFKDIDVSRDRAAARDMTRRSRQQGVPVIDINGKIIVGFNRIKVDRELGL
ncbi:MAG: glutaredoxin domain-containing protein [Chloroflexota bacterium]|nr:glutaredoxin domain-containing protein [Chloroflexota bacterium]